MKKLLLSGIIILFISCTDVTVKRVSLDKGIEYENNHGYTMEQCYFSGMFKTYIWYKGDIVKSWSIETEELTPELERRDSIEASNFINKIKDLQP